MLHELVVENYAVVDRLRVRFHEGLNLLTGEAGSGKSIVVDALGLLLGGRASADMIRSGEVRELFVEWRRVSSEIAQREGSEQEKNRLLDLWQFQHREIESVSLKPGEDVELDAERRVQQNAGKLLETAGAAWEALYEAPESAWSTARGVAKKLDELARIDPSMEPVRQALEPALIAMQDVSYSLRDYLGNLET